jgi:tight adherence protein B
MNTSLMLTSGELLSELSLLKLLAVTCLTISGSWCLAWLLCSSDSVWHRVYFRHIASLERLRRSLFLELSAQHIVWAQGLAALLVVVMAVALHKPLASALLVVIAVAPQHILEAMRVRRVEQIELKLDGFIVALANALRASPSPGRALAMIQPVTPAPLDREIELVLREMRVGSTLEQALGNLSARVRSFQLDAAMSGLLIGRQTGGNVSEILDGSAQTLREMARLQGVLRSKTAEGRAQANVLALAPLVLIFAFDFTSPGYFRPLTESLTGVVVMLSAIALWLGSVVMTRRIVSVQL